MLLQTNAPEHRLQTSLKRTRISILYKIGYVCKFPRGGGSKPILSHPSKYYHTLNIFVLYLCMYYVLLSFGRPPVSWLSFDLFFIKHIEHIALPGPAVMLLYFMVNLTEHELYHANQC